MMMQIFTNIELHPKEAVDDNTEYNKCWVNEETVVHI
jgi:hypothetical protein